METSIVESELTDGSKVYALVFVDGAQEVNIACESKLAAEELMGAFLRFAVYATIDQRK